MFNTFVKNMVIQWHMKGDIANLDYSDHLPLHLLRTALSCSKSSRERNTMTVNCSHRFPWLWHWDAEFVHLDCRSGDGGAHSCADSILLWEPSCDGDTMFAVSSLLPRVSCHLAGWCGCPSLPTAPVLGRSIWNTLESPRVFHPFTWERVSVLSQGGCNDAWRSWRQLPRRLHTDTAPKQHSHVGAMLGSGWAAHKHIQTPQAKLCRF